MIPFFALAACSQPKATLPALDLSDLDTTVSPKVDFYRYATGGWQAKNPLRPEFARSAPSTPSPKTPRSSSMTSSLR